ncbi:GIY-YIG nuclease family protein [Bacillus sp. BP-3]|uniref:GIY-YIG nuclease family protein n=1 Tax=Bacillus sp. BP-3 TaxID=3022773 RepID=UPI00232BBDB1|nr:GIY-YIG nuclease family protein [Bacillus sp. BP-3]MDC2867744.1 GIY-YIG nuclease family protein [Bacillus sp. BP-3]
MKQNQNSFYGKPITKYPSVTLECKDIKDGFHLNVSGVYVFYAVSGVSLYVGMSTNLRGRILEHLQGKNEGTELLNNYFHRVKVYLIEDENEREAYEHELINELFPLFNVAGNDSMHIDFLSRFRSFVKEIISEQEQKTREIEKPRDEVISVFDSWEKEGKIKE